MTLAVEGLRVGATELRYAVPVELADLFRSHAPAREVWSRLEPREQRAYVDYITGAKLREIRERRAALAVTMLASRKSILF